MVRDEFVYVVEYVVGVTDQLKLESPCGKTRHGISRVGLFFYVVNYFGRHLDAGMLPDFFYCAAEGCHDILPRETKD